MLSGTGWLRRTWAGGAADVAAAYRRQLAPDDAAARLVLADLARLCCATQSSVVPGDPQGTAFNEGKRAVWLHVQDMLALRPERLTELMERSER
ncbi:MAG: hypothetical protein H6842_15315 [Rhodospirillaceae bacterium]|nr:hypothetical protein [Rhodospirillaceae bacterium]